MPDATLQSLSDALAAAVEVAGGSLVAVQARRTESTGVHWRDGLVVTAEHCVKRDEDIRVVLPDGHAVAASLAGRDAGTDLAVLRIPEGLLPVAEQADAARLRVGHVVVAVARSSDDGLGVSMGVLSALSGPWRTWRGGHVERFVQPDLTLYPGFSGGALADVAGRALGIATSGLSRSLSIALPGDTVDRVVDEILRRGHVRRGYMGIAMHPVRLQPSIQKKLQRTQDTAVVLVNVEPGGPAEQAGMLVGDVVVGVGGQPVCDVDEMLAIVGREGATSVLALSVLRGGVVTDVSLTLGERPARDL